MKKLLVAAAALLGVSTTAQAGITPVLDTVTLIGSEYEFSYSATLGGDVGLVDGSYFIIYDFAGYVAGTISAGIYASDLDAFVENTSALAPIGFDDDPTLVNLVFKWKGSPFNAAGGPFADVSFAGLTARSTFGGVLNDGFSAVSVVNNGSGTGLPDYEFGPVGVPDGGGGGNEIPEPATWALMLAGFGLAGTALRTRRALARA